MANETVDAQICTVTVCRGCCCGTDKHPESDGPAQLAQLADGMGAAGRLKVTGCLSSCDFSNTMVVQPSERGRAVGGRPSWLRHILTPELTQAVVDWVNAGGPGLAEQPASLREHRLSPARDRRKAPAA
ncbi:(2Fe-2S) ferredoxin domain-containing protein [Streptomyces sp. NPDC050433]|uniref:(2Fe-2S) ferredoxin domain-containing protein n=1 Tax=Streptomyces sp. NPDC050433 TaxID=3365615 RepID=UPI0037AF5AF5